MLVILCAEIVWVGGGVAWRLMRMAPPSRLVDSELLNVHDSFRNRVESLQQQLVRAVQADPTPRAWLDLGSLYLTTGYYPEAELCLRYAQTLAPKSYEIAYALGSSLYLLGHTSEAIEQYRHASRFTTGRPREACLYLIGKCHLRQEEPEKAAAAFREIYTFLPASYELVKILIRTGKIDMARSEMRILNYNRPNSLETHALTSRIAAAQGDLAAAAKHRRLADTVPRKTAFSPLQDICIDFRRRFPEN